ncbi:MAG: hypothetical protein ABSC47_09295 [Terracidiphilus sp.]
MCNTISHMFDGVRPFDWVMLIVEVLALVLIGYQVWLAFRERRTKQERERLLAAKRSWLSGIMARGEQLRQDTPVEAATFYDHATFRPWLESVDVWGRETAESLSKECPKAAIVFNLMRPAGTAHVIAYTPNKAGSPFQVSGKIREAYVRLVEQLANLTEIMEKADFYF